MDGQCLLPNTVLPSKFDGLNFDGLAGKRQNRLKFPPVKISRYTVLIYTIAYEIYRSVGPLDP